MPKPALKILKEKNVLIIIPPSKFNESEFDYIYNYLKDSKVTVKITSPKKNAVGMMGGVVKSTINLSKVKVVDFDAVVVIGDCRGSIDTIFYKNDPIIQIIKKANTKKKIIAASCAAPALLAIAGVVKDKVVTAWRDPSLVTLLKEKGASYIWEPVVIDGNIVTSDSPSSAKMFARVIIDALTR